MKIPEDLKYTRDHEWARLDNKILTIGITSFACGQLGDIVYVELPKKDEQVKAGATLGVVESTKAVSDVFSPVSGKVIEVNSTLSNSPELVSNDPYTEGWLAKIELDDPKELDGLMDAIKYTEHIKDAGH